MADESVAQDQIKSFVRRIESEEDVKKAANDALSDIYKEAKGNGFNVKVLRKIIADRRKDQTELNEFEAVYDLYWSAINGVAHAHVENIEKSGSDGREERRRERMSESMSDAKALSAEAAALGLISAEAHAETARLTDAVASKFGNGPIPEHDADGVIIEPQSPSAAPDLTSNATPSVAGQVEHTLQDMDYSSDVTAEAVAKMRAKAAPALARTVLEPIPGEVRLETCPPEPVRWHEFANCFPTVLGDDLAALEADIHKTFGGVQKPIVKIGNLILDGRARYGIARSMLIPYPVVEYDGTDPLADVIRWNLETRKLSTSERKAVAAKLMKLPSVAHRASEIAAMFELEVEEA